MAERFDLVVLGAGPGGYVAAIRAAQLGKKVACLDKRGTFGGTCLNIGCIPSKALLDSSEHYYQATHSFAKHGILVGKIGLDIPAMIKRKNNIVKGLVDGIAFLFKKYGVRGIFGSGKIVGKNQVEVRGNDGSTSLLEAENILVATGSEPSTLPFLPVDGKNIVTSTEALDFETVPEHLIVIGGGYIGLEMGSVWLRLGAKVTVIEFLPKLLPLNDGEIAALAHRSLVRQGFTFHLETKVTAAKVEGKQVTVTAESKDGPVKIKGDKVLVSTGRRPITQGIGLEAVGVQADAKTGKIPVNEHLQTNVPNIYALGDIIHGPMLAHKAMEEGVAVAEHLAGMVAHVDYDIIPSVIYIWPELAAVGKTEEQLKEEHREYRVGKFPFMVNGRAKAMEETEGTVKILSDAKTDRVLGVHIFGPRASDMIAEAVTTMAFKGSAEDMARIVHGHPTLSEAVGEAARVAWLGKALHI
jgi:dihydrolipoamide dehydrogenase